MDGKTSTTPRPPAHSLKERPDASAQTSRREQTDERGAYRPSGYAETDQMQQGGMNTHRAALGEANYPVGHGFAASAPTALALLGGIWLAISRSVYDFLGAGSTPGGVTNGIIIGIFVALIALVRLSNGMSSPALNAVIVVLGGWMIASPWVFGYQTWGSAPPWSDIITGAAILLAALASWPAMAMRKARR